MMRSPVYLVNAVDLTRVWKDGRRASTALPWPRPLPEPARLRRARLDFGGQVTMLGSSVTVQGALP
jgi:hypothetical protein